MSAPSSVAEFREIFQPQTHAGPLTYGHRGWYVSDGRSFNELTDVEVQAWHEVNVLATTHDLRTLNSGTPFDATHWQATYRERLAAKRAAQREAAQQETTAQREAQLARERSKWRKVCGSMVVAMLAMGGVLLAVILSENGSGKPNRGDELRDGGRQLRNDAHGRLRSARPNYSSWSGLSGGADDYAARVDQQQAWVEALMAADLQAADIVATQADQVEQARWAQKAALGVLTAGIPIATALQAAECEIALVVFGTVLALDAIGTAIGALSAQDEAARHTDEALTAVIDTYQWIADNVAATMPTGEASQGWMPSHRPEDNAGAIPAAHAGALAT